MSATLKRGVLCLTAYLACTVLARRYVPGRSHAGCVPWPLRRSPLSGVRALVRCPRAGGFATRLWWRNREDARSLARENPRLANGLNLGDPSATAQPG